MLYEARWYSPTDYNIHHLCVVEANDIGEAASKLHRANVPLRMPDPVSLVPISERHAYGKGYDPKFPTFYTRAVQALKG